MRPTTERLDRRYSDVSAEAVPWAAAQARLAEADLAWIVTVRPDGRPHATPMVPVVHDGRVYFHTGRTEVKYANLQASQHVLVLAGDTAWDGGLDVAFEGTATEVIDDALLRRVAELYRHRWDGRWQLEVAEGVVVATNPEIRVMVFEVTPGLARAHVKGDPFGQTTYRFANGHTQAQEGPS